MEEPHATSPYVNQTITMDPHRSTLPLELCEQIIDDLLDDSHALAACGLICRALLPRTRAHLFRVITITTEEYERFKSLLDKSPRIGEFVRNLAIIKPRRMARRKKDYVYWTSEPGLLVSIFQRLRNITGLFFANWGTRQMSDELRASLPALFPMVESIHFSGCYFEPPDFARILCACPKLSRIEYPHTGRSYAEGRMPDSHFLETLHPPGRKLQISHIDWRCNARVCANCLLQGPFDLHMCSLCLCLQSGSTCGQALISAAGQSLEHLTVHTQPFLDEDRFRSLDLSLSTSLVSLHIVGMIFPSPLALILASSKIHSIHTRFQRLYIQISMEHCVTRATADVAATDVWPQIDEELVRVSRLTRDRSPLVVTFYIHYHHAGKLVLPEAHVRADIQRCMDSISGALPRLQAESSRLRVLHVEDYASGDIFAELFKPPSITPFFDSEPNGPPVPESEIAM